VRRPFVFRRSRFGIRILCRPHDGGKSLQPIAKGIDFALLAQYFFAQYSVCVIQERDPGLESFQRVAIHVTQNDTRIPTERVPRLPSDTIGARETALACVCLRSVSA
jgi:hypothetical protein